MARKLKAYVYLPDPDNAADYIGFGPDDELPAWTKDLISDFAFEDVPDRPAAKPVRSNPHK